MKHSPVGIRNSGFPPRPGTKARMNSSGPRSALNVLDHAELLGYERFHLFLIFLVSLYHSGLMARNDCGKTVFFVGDSFRPSMDDYCLLNRNFLPPEKGFLTSLHQIRAVNGDYLLINQYVAPALQFSQAQLNFMTSVFSKRVLFELRKPLNPKQITS